jgi:hypothetical protein
MQDSTFVISTTPSNPWSSIIGSVISGLVALGIFLLGQHFERRKTKKRKNSDLKALEQYVSFQVQDLYHSAIKQSASLISFIRKLRMEKEQDYHFPSISSFNPKSLSTIDNLQLFSMLVLNRTGNRDINTKAYSEIIKSLALLSNIKELMLDWFRDLNNKYQNYIHDYKEHLERVVRTMEDFGTVAEQANINKNGDIFLSSYDQIIYELLKDQEYKDIHKSYSKLILPMHALCSDKKKVHADPRANIILKDLMQAKYCFENYLNLKKTYVNEYCKQARSINSTVISLRKHFDTIIINNLKE